MALLEAWQWLNRPNNQRTLAFIGAGLAGAIALLAQLGVFDKKEAPSTTQTVAPSPQPVTPPPVQAPATAPAVSQNAESGPGGTVINIMGSGNSVTAPSKR